MAAAAAAVASMVGALVRRVRCNTATCIADMACDRLVDACVSRSVVVAGVDITNAVPALHVHACVTMALLDVAGGYLLVIWLWAAHATRSWVLFVMAVEFQILAHGRGGESALTVVWLASALHSSRVRYQVHGASGGSRRAVQAHTPAVEP